ncbi:death domain-associated protein 6 isoform X2 [Thalassophryne amazonica]|uniref:death domain-associated protein 6 isoform X2 n=1 Tax=Thalassophryne amazonica TaxID=390379 RepID=UPI0014708FC3|nr:death domain-associated protein 6 isoform X2 [Thalassophryne amazonica]
MVVAPASMADKIVVLDDDDEEKSLKTFCSTTTSSNQRMAKYVSPLKAKQPVPTHITQSPFATAKKDKHVLQEENKKLFAEFVDHCTPLTQDCPEVLNYLCAKHDKASPDFLSSVEFRNTLGRCLTRAQATRSKTFVYINELCTVLKQHTIKKRTSFVKVEPGPSTSTSHSFQSTSKPAKREDKGNVKVEKKDGSAKMEDVDEQPSTSGLQGDKKVKVGDTDVDKQQQRASRKQIAYLENLLKVYNDEIHRLQQAELSLDELGMEHSSYIQEHKLKRKMMKIYEKLCEIKGCNTLTGRVIEQRIIYKSTRYPEINRKIERFINSPEAQRNPPDYQDILQQVLRANERHNLSLSRKQLNQIAQEAFTETGSRLQERRHLDMVYNFGSWLTDSYKTTSDPALSDAALQRQLRSNREMSLSHLEDVITKYAVKQENTEEQDRCKRMKKDNQDKEVQKTKEVNGLEEEEEDEDDDDDDDESSDPDIEEEIQASVQQNGSDDEADGGNEAEQTCDSSNGDEQKEETDSSITADEQDSVKDEDDKAAVTSGLSPLSGENTSRVSPSSNSPSQSEPVPTDDKQLLVMAGGEEPADSSSQVPLVAITASHASLQPTGLSPDTANGLSSLPSPSAGVMEVKDLSEENGNTPTALSRSPPPSPRITRSHKRKREEMVSEKSQHKQHVVICESETEIPLDMGVFSCSSPLSVESTRVNTPIENMVSSSQSTPPPKINKVNVATQYDPHEVIILSDSE